MALNKICILAGSGLYPELLVRGALAAGVSCVDVLAVRGSTARATCRAAHHVHFCGLGEIAPAVSWVAGQG
jgi:DUF1009 family protein